MLIPQFSRGGRRKAGARRNAPPPRRFPWFQLFLVIFMTGFFGYFLYSISGSADKPSTTVASKPAAPAKPAAQPKPAAKPTPDPLPPKPKEQWRYIEELENKTVEVELPEVESKPTRPYLMQCGSFRTQKQADGLKARIAFQGLHSEVRRSDGKNGTWYRVVLGPYDRKRNAERDRHKLQRASINGCQIWFWS